VTKFLDDHPGGDEVILTSTGKITDLSWFATSCFAHSYTVYVYKNVLLMVFREGCDR